MNPTDELTDPTSWDGVVPIDKAPGMTSHDVVARVRRALRPLKIKVGHAGTLDPDATGVLLVCLGSGTRLAELLANQGKTYDAEFQLGVTTSSEDASGEVLSECDAGHVTRAQVEDALAALTGDIEQIPPMVSAVHHEGKRLYELARAGITVERAARTISVARIELKSFSAGDRHPIGSMTVDCGKGTYVRTLCADLGARLEVGGHMTRLRRTRVGVFLADRLLPIDDISAETIKGHRVSASTAVEFLPFRRLSAGERADVLHGRNVPIGDIVGAIDPSGWIRLVDESDQLIALATTDDSASALAPKRVLAQAS